MGGGILTYLVQLCNNIDNQFDIYILYGRRKQTPDNLEKLFNSGITLIEINNFQRSLSITKDMKAYREIEHHIDHIQPDIVHLNSSKAGALGRILKFIHAHKYKNIKFYYTPHGYAFLMMDSSKIKRCTYYGIEKILGMLNTKTIACGYGEHKFANKISKNSTYINNGVDTDKLSHYWTDKSNSEEIVFTIGRIGEQKNPELFNKIALKYPNMKFVWIGDGEQKYKLTANNIEITGWLSNDEVMKKIQPYRYFILCSKWEGLPISLFEAMYFKKLCFVTNVIGNKDVIKDGYNGFIFKDCNLKGPFFYSDNNFINNVISNANNNIYKSFSLTKFVKSYLNVYYRGD